MNSDSHYVGVWNAFSHDMRDQDSDLFVCGCACGRAGVRAYVSVNVLLYNVLILYICL